MFGLHIKRARQVVKDQQRGMAHKHACSGSALCLTARKVNSSRQIGSVLRNTQQDIVAHCSTEQARDLRSIGCVRRFEEIRGISDELTVPVDLATLFR